MMVQYLFSSPEGDVLIDEKTLNRPFLLNPFEEHPFLTVRDYFRGIEGFVLNSSLFQAPLDRMLIRSEKHGTLYHVASVELIGLGARRKFAASIAFSEPRKELLLREYKTMRHLNQRFPYGYLPKVHMASEVSCSCPKGNETAVMSVSDWLEGYHEWHLGEDEEGKQAVLIWDTEKGSRTASREQSRSLFREASKILTLYYDPDTYHQICPWHHAAGDFVVNLSEGIVQVKLTTARNYLPLISFPTKADTNRVTALVAFLLNMTVQMRLDRIGGVGEPVWAQEGLVSPCLEGFFEALRTMKAEGRGDWGQESDLNAFLKSLSKEELHSLYAPLMQSYHEEKPEDSKVIEKNLETHIATLWKALQAFGEAGLEEES